jgi:hypothetical protein
MTNPEIGSYWRWNDAPFMGVKVLANFVHNSEQFIVILDWSGPDKHEFGKKIISIKQWNDFCDAENRNDHSHLVKV